MFAVLFYGIAGKKVTGCTPIDCILTLKNKKGYGHQEMPLSPPPSKITRHPSLFLKAIKLESNFTQMCFSVALPFTEK